jgi:hypothetical protein
MENDLFSQPAHIEPDPVEAAWRKGQGKTMVRAAKWIEENPQAMRLYFALADKAIKAGMKGFGIRWLSEVVRWEYALNYPEGELKINNNFCPWISRHMIKVRPELEQFFTFRKTKGEEGGS